MLFGVFYRPPNSDHVYGSAIEDSIHLAIDTGIMDIVITGDFNYNMLNDVTKRKISSICQQFSLQQCIDQPTHFTENSCSLIDLIFVSNEDNALFCGVGEPFLSQDVRFHCPVFGILNFSKPKSKSFTRHIWSYDRGDFNLLREKASLTDWNLLKNEDIDTYACNITNHILELSKQCIPNKTIRVRPSDLPWITCAIKKHIRKRKRLFRKAKATQDNEIWAKFRRQRNKTTSLIRRSKQTYLEKLAEKLKCNDVSSRDWWSTLKGFICPNKTKTIPPLHSNGNIITETIDKANLLNNFFRDQTIIDDYNIDPPTVTAYPVFSELDSLILTSDDVLSVLKLLPIGKAAGPDGVSNRILKELSEQIAEPLTSLFNESLTKSCIPQAWKIANVSPIAKNDDPSLPSNYRPISLLSNLDKVFERVIFKHIHNHLRDNNILTEYQSGFTPGDSTTNQLTYLYDTFCQALDLGKEVRVVFCDISKAFDRVWHKGLICKLKAAGITGTLLSWFQDYLSNRKQSVVIPGATSELISIGAGVPQGSILGPILFLLYINDIVSEIGSNIRLFADDTSLYIIVEQPETAALQLNLDLEIISDWAKRWLVSFNPNKTEAMIISRKVNKPYHPPLLMTNCQIQEVDSHKHLGLHFSNNGSWHNHIESIKEKAWQRVNVMRKLKFLLDRKSLEIIYISFIRPLLEYGDTIWDNCTLYEKRELDKIQNEAARIVTGATALVSLQALYNEVGWDSLQTRRTNHKLITFFKMQHGLVPHYLSSLTPPSFSETSMYNTRNADDYITIQCHSQSYFNSFLPSVVREWNNLPQQAKQITSLLSFKSFLTSNKIKVPKYYYHGKRKWQAMHVRLRTNCSALNSDLHLKNIVDSGVCSCGAIENAHHYFFQCDKYRHQRDELYTELAFLPSVTLKILLYGDESRGMNDNIHIFDSVQKFIANSKRF